MNATLSWAQYESPFQQEYASLLSSQLGRMNKPFTMVLRVFYVNLLNKCITYLYHYFNFNTLNKILSVAVGEAHRSSLRTYPLANFLGQYP